jgi:[protein-PII] uridylyltransferase
VFVRTPDRDGVFAALVATFDRLGLGVLDARVLTSNDGYALDNFQLGMPAGHAHAADDVARAVENALRDPARVRPARRIAPRQLRHFPVPTRVEFDSDPAAGRTRLSLVCSDRPGLLARLAQVLRAHRLRVHDARIATFGERVEDFFLLADEQDRAVTDPAELDRLRRDLLACAEGDD